MLKHTMTPSMHRASLHASRAPWSIYAWPAVFCQADSRQAHRFVHLGTRVVHAGDADRAPFGQTLWGDRTPDSETGLAWDWVQVCSGVVAMADPLSVVTNMRLLSARGRVLTAREAALHLNRLVHQLPWQDEVQLALQLE
ncbi:hypothetical protein [Ideonella livida]|uniref:Uncharacterized protein n=1 Tax=Ideonella livida TaxID=2707176 RepID=A0A7C9PIJ7_9BURK|nr:hypothetical protein [Ideonella livida]NDY92708.1 hypothetical protein [Ideonella livida]